MDKTALVGADVEAGRRVIQKLESLGIVVDVAAWLQDDETAEWRLFLSSPALARPGSKRVYDAVVSILGNVDDPDLELDNILVLSPTDGVIDDLRGRVRTNDDLQNIRLDALNLGERSFRAAHIYRVTGGRGTAGKIERGARVRVKETGRLGTVHGVVRTPGGPRYLVLYDVNTDNVRQLGERPPPPIGQDYAADDLELLYVVRSGGWPEKNPDWLVAATIAPGEVKANITFRRARR
jgi:hypothetical protein